MFNMVGRGPKWSNLSKFHKGGPCREQQEAKMTDQNRRLGMHVARNFLVLFLLKHLSFLGNGSGNVDSPLCVFK